MELWENKKHNIGAIISFLIRHAINTPIQTNNRCWPEKYHTWPFNQFNTQPIRCQQMPYVGSVSLLRLFLFGPIFNFFIFFLNALKRVSKPETRFRCFGNCRNAPKTFPVKFPAFPCPKHFGNAETLGLRRFRAS